MLDVGVLLESGDIGGRALGKETRLGMMKVLVIEVEGGKLQNWILLKTVLKNNERVWVL